MDKIINKINNDIREMQINPCDEIALIGRSIYFHFRAVVKLYDKAVELDCKHRCIDCGIEVSRMKDRILELGSEIKVMNSWLMNY